MPFAFQDESGNLGYDFEKGASRYFVLALLLIDDPEPLRQRIKRLRHERRLPDGYEFKFRRVKGRKDLARIFFQAIAPIHFTIRVAVVDKAQVSEIFHEMNRQDVYNFVIGQLMLRMPDEAVFNTRLIIDGATQSKTFTRRLRKHLSDLAQAEQRPIRFKRVTERDSKSDEALQCIDMIVGAIAEKWTRGKDEFYRMFESKVVDLWLYPFE